MIVYLLANKTNAFLLSRGIDCAASKIYAVLGIIIPPIAVLAPPYPENPIILGTWN